MALLGPLLALLFNTGHLLDTLYLASLMLVDSRGLDWSYAVGLAIITKDHCQ